MKNTLKLKPLDNKRMMFIDCVSGYAFPKEDKIDEAFYHKPPKNLSELKEIIKFGFQKSRPDIVVLDSLSQFMNFSQITEESISELYKFLKRLKEEKNNCFILLYDNTLGLLENLPKKQTDHILKIEKKE